MKQVTMLKEQENEGDLWPLPAGCLVPSPSQSWNAASKCLQAEASAAEAQIRFPPRLNAASVSGREERRIPAALRLLTQGHYDLMSVCCLMYFIYSGLLLCNR